MKRKRSAYCACGRPQGLRIPSISPKVTASIKVVNNEILNSIGFCFYCFRSANEKSNISYNLLCCFFNLISLFNAAFSCHKAEGDSKEYTKFCLFLVTYSKTWNQVIYIDHVILPFVIILGFTIDQKGLSFIVYERHRYQKIFRITK